MLEIPEANTLTRQLDKTVVGKKITNAVAGASPHGFAWFSGDPAAYGAMLNGKTIKNTACPVCGGPIKRMSYLGGNVYVCEECQPLATQKT